MFCRAMNNPLGHVAHDAPTTQMLAIRTYISGPPAPNLQALVFARSGHHRRRRDACTRRVCQPAYNGHRSCVTMEFSSTRAPSRPLRRLCNGLRSRLDVRRKCDQTSSHRLPAPTIESRELVRAGPPFLDLENTFSGPWMYLDV